MSDRTRPDDDADGSGLQAKPAVDASSNHQTSQAHVEHAQQREQAAGSHNVNMGGWVLALPQYQPSIAQPKVLPPVAPLHGPAANHAVAVVVPADFERFNPKLGVNQLRSVIEPAQVAAINAACAAKDLPRARQLLREAFGSIAERVNTVGDAVALGHIKEAGRAPDSLAATRLYFAAAQRLRELAKAPTQALPATARVAASVMGLGSVVEGLRKTSPVPASGAPSATAAAAADANGRAPATKYMFVHGNQLAQAIASMVR